MSSGRDTVSRMTKPARRPLPILALPIPGTVTPTSLQLQGIMPFSKYLDAARLLGKIGHGVPWWCGDLLNYGEARYGERYAQAEAVMGLDAGTLANIASVCSRVDPSRRREQLSFAHHAEVAKLEPQDQATWLARAERDGLTRAALRKALKGEVPAAPDCPPHTCSRCGAIFP